MRYFLAANFWLFVTLLLIVGRTFERDLPTRYSIFHLGRWFSPGTYWLLVAFPFVVSLCFFIVCKKQAERKPNEKP